MRQLADELGVTSNAVRNHVDALEGRGLVESRGLRRDTGGKPARIYGLTAQGEASFATAYVEVLRALLDALGGGVEAATVERVLDRAGRRLAHEFEWAGEGLDARLRRAAEVLNEMGGMAEVDATANPPAIVGRGCPLAALVDDHPGVCRMARALVSEITGRPVRERCDRSRRPACRFAVADGRDG